MIVITSNIEAIPAEAEEIKKYCIHAAKEINLLFEKHDIRNISDELEKIDSNRLIAQITFSDFFQPTPLRKVFFACKHQFIPHEIVDAFHRTISNAPPKIKIVVHNEFLDFLEKNEFLKLLSNYLEMHYSILPESQVNLIEIEDFSFSSPLYKLTLATQQHNTRKDLALFLKGISELQSHNELLYFQIQKELLSSAKYVKLPRVMSSNYFEDKILISPSLPGLTSDIVLSRLIQTYEKKNDTAEINYLKKLFDAIIKAFIQHAALGDILGRNDRNLSNSCISLISDDQLQNLTNKDLDSFEKIIDLGKKISSSQNFSISLVCFDFNWLLEEQNYDWILADIDYGLSEINLLQLLPEFNDYDSKSNQYIARKNTLQSYLDTYLQEQENILLNEKFIFSEIKNVYRDQIANEKTQLLTRKLSNLREDTKYILKLFKRYLLNFRIRTVYKETLFTLYSTSKSNTDTKLLNTLKNSGLLKYIPQHSNTNISENNIYSRLEAFRGVLSASDRELLKSKERDDWETVSSKITIIAKNFDHALYSQLMRKIKFIEEDTIMLLNEILPINEKQTSSNSTPFQLNRHF